MEGLRVGMLGCGAVGTGVARLLVEHGRPVRDRAGVPIALQRVAVRDVTRKRDPAVDPTMVSGDAAAVVADPEVDVVVEVMGGIEPARSLILEAIRLGKPVVTANKELLAAHGGELFDAADAAGVDLRFEAVPDGLSDEDRRGPDRTVRLYLSLRRSCGAPLVALARRLAACDDGAPPVTCVVLSGLVSFALDAAEAIGVPAFVLWGTSACGFVCTLRLRELRQRGYTPLKGPSVRPSVVLDRLSLARVIA